MSEKVSMRPFEVLLWKAINQGIENAGFKAEIRCFGHNEMCPELELSYNIVFKGVDEKMFTDEKMFNDEMGKVAAAVDSILNKYEMPCESFSKAFPSTCGVDGSDDCIVWDYDWYGDDIDRLVAEERSVKLAVFDGFISKEQALQEGKSYSDLSWGERYL